MEVSTAAGPRAAHFPPPSAARDRQQSCKEEQPSPPHLLPNPTRQTHMFCFCSCCTFFSSSWFSAVQAATLPRKNKRHGGKTERFCWSTSETSHQLSPLGGWGRQNLSWASAGITYSKAQRAPPYTRYEKPCQSCREAVD